MPCELSGMVPVTPKSSNSANKSCMVWYGIDGFEQNTFAVWWKQNYHHVFCFFIEFCSLCTFILMDTISYKYVCRISTCPTFNSCVI